MAKKEFTWVEFYTKFADKLLEYKNNRKELIRKLKEAIKMTGKKFPKMEEDGKIYDIDPFSVFSLFNKKQTKDTRMQIVKAIIEIFSVDCALPEDYVGIPVQIPLVANFFRFKKERNGNEFNELWELFENALAYADNMTQKKGII